MKITAHACIPYGEKPTTANANLLTYGVKLTAQKHDILCSQGESNTKNLQPFTHLSVRKGGKISLNHHLSVRKGGTTKHFTLFSVRKGDRMNLYSNHSGQNIHKMISSKQP